MKETLNLLPIEGKPSVIKKRSNLYYLFWGLGVYIIVMIGLWSFSVIEGKRFDAEINRLNKQKMEMQQKILLPAAPVAISGEREILKAVEKIPKWSLIMSDISVVVPENVWLSSIESKEDRGMKQMNIKGFSRTQLGVANLISALERSEHFTDVEIVFAQKGERDVSFELKARLRWT